MSKLDTILTHLSNDALNHIDKKAEYKQQIIDLMLELIDASMVTFNEHGSGEFKQLGESTLRQRVSEL